MNAMLMTMIELSRYSEVFSGIHVTDNEIYAVGEYASYVQTESNRRFGYALISILDTHTGIEKYHLGFGSPDYSSYFGSTFVDGARAFCAGWRDRMYLDGGYRAWLAEVKIDSLAGSTKLELQRFGSLNCEDVKGGHDEIGNYHLHDSAPPPGMLR
ncbi:MAG: hypothetical protein ABIA59_03170 [Candidatus Latescibacterota bacterium]